MGAEKDIMFAADVEPRSSARRRSSALHYVIIIVCVSLVLSIAPTVSAQNQSDPAGINCLSDSDKLNSTVLKVLNMSKWLRRGRCIRGSDQSQCYANLQATLSNLNVLRSAEYNGAAGVLTLLPTVGALLGAPTYEIWKLMAIVPFGGGLAMTLSFGGAILPVRVEDYEDLVDRKDVAIGSVHLARHLTPDQGARRLSLLTEKIRQRLKRAEGQRLSRAYLWSGLVAMVVLLCAAQVAMGIVEQGGVVAWWCQSRSWMHVWYVVVTLIAVTESLVHTPFIKAYKLYVSTVPYDISITGGDHINKSADGEASDNVSAAIRRLNNLRFARVLFHGSGQHAQPHNSVMVMVSVVGDSFWRQNLRLLGRCFSIAVFILGTSIFASVTMLSLKMAVLVLTLTLAAGVFGRAIASWLVSSVSENEPMIHMIVNTHQEAHRAIGEVLSLGSDEGALFQTEIDGHIFINGRRVGKRSSLWISILGIIAQPYDLKKAQQNRSSVEAESPFLSLNRSSPFSRSQKNFTRLHVNSVDSEGTDLAYLMAGDHRIPRKPVQSFASFS